MREENDEKKIKAFDDAKQLVCFKLADEIYAFEIIHVQEVIRLQHISLLPQMPEFVLGISNVRGNVLPIYDLRKKCKLPEKAFDERSKIIILSDEEELYGYVVDEVLENIKVSASTIEAAPKVKMPLAQECIQGIAMDSARAIVILDVMQLIEAIRSEIKAVEYYL